LKLITCGNGFVEGEIQLYKPMLLWWVNECLIRGICTKVFRLLLNGEHLSRSDQVPDDTVNPLGPCNDLSILIIHKTLFSIYLTWWALKCLSKRNKTQGMLAVLWYQWKTSSKTEMDLGSQSS
jgi:hypothetical protein